MLGNLEYTNDQLFQYFNDLRGQEFWALTHFSEHYCSKQLILPPIHSYLTWS